MIKLDLKKLLGFRMAGLSAGKVGEKGCAKVGGKVTAVAGVKISEGTIAR